LAVINTYNAYIIRMRFLKSICLTVIVTISQIVNSQPFVVDGVVGVVGKNQILYSDVEDQYRQMEAQGVKPLPTKCEMFEELLSQKLLVTQAEVDSIEVGDAEVEMELQQRITYFINQIGSEEKLVAYFNKSILEIKEDMREAVRDQILMQRMRSQITTDANITPSEVKDFYNSLPYDSIPNIDAEVEINQILIYPASSQEAIFEVKEKLLGIRERIVNGENFATLAVLYSEGPSAPKGGDIGWAAKADLDPAYSKVAFSLKVGQVSKIVESAFGYHIIQLLERTEDRVHTRHILMKPKLSINEKENAEARLDSIVKLIRIDTLTFEKAAAYFSMDDDTRMNGGAKINPATGNTRFKLSDFETKEYYIIDELKVGEISEPFESTDDKGKVVFKSIWLRSKSEPHKANLKQDYDLIKQFALQKKEVKIVDQWVAEKIKNTYVEINDPFKDCSFRIKQWSKK
jgi:peptidyl-prolyl cis-trans isomerase SurA